MAVPVTAILKKVAVAVGSNKNVLKTVCGIVLGIVVITYHAIYVPTGVNMPPKHIVELPELKVYYQDFGTRAGDICLIAETDNKIVGAVWTRIVNDFGHIDDDVPSLAIAVSKESRGNGIGTRLLLEMIEVLKKERFSAVSLSVQKENFAVKLYERAGFEVVKDNGEELVMLKIIKECKVQQLINEKNELQEKLRLIHKEKGSQKTTQNRLDSIYTVIDGLKNCPMTYNDEVVRKLIECVVIESKNQIKVVFRDGTQMEQTLQDENIHWLTNFMLQ